MKLKSRRHRSTKRHKKQYTRSAKRLLRLKRKTMRSKHMRSKHMRSKHMHKRRSYKMRGGADPAPAPNNGASVTPYSQSGTSNANIHTDMKAGDRNQNSGNIALKGGSGKKRQSGGDNLALYAYEPPPGMMGPIPQPSQTPEANNLILQAAKISTTGQANAVYDKNVGNAPVASK